MKRRQSFDREYETLRSIGEGTGDGGEEGGVVGGTGRVTEPDDEEADADGVWSRVEEGAKRIDEPESSACRLVRV